MKKYIFRKKNLIKTGVILITVIVVLTNLVASQNCLPPPTVEIINPHDGDTVDGTVYIEVTAIDDSGIIKVTFKIDGVEIGLDETAPYSCSWDTTLYSNGWHTVTAIANCYDGDTGSDSVTVCVRGNCNNLPPYKPSNPSPADGAIDVDTNADLSWIGGDPNPGDTVTYDIYFGTSLVNLAPIAIDYTQITYDPGPMNPNTMYYWRIYAWDNWGAGAKGTVWSFTTRNNPPTVEILSPVDGDIVADIIVISGTASDPDGNNDLQEVHVRIDNGGWMLATETTSWTYEWDTRPTSRGLHTIYARSWDGTDYSITDQIDVLVCNENQLDQTTVPCTPGCSGTGGLLAQSFTPTLEVLTMVELRLDTNIIDGPDICVSIRSSLTGSDLTSVIVDGLNIPLIWDWVEFDFFPDITVTPNQIYYIIMSNIPHSYSTIWWTPEYDYPNGHGWEYVTGGWHKVNDFTFRSYGYTPLKPNTPVITGDSNGKIKKPYTYQFNTIHPDPCCSTISEYIVNWGDGPDETINGPFASGVAASATHTWTKIGTYVISVKAIDICGKESDLGTFTVTLKWSFSKSIPLVLKNYFQRFPILEKILNQIIQ